MRIFGLGQQDLLGRPLLKSCAPQDIKSSALPASKSPQLLCAWQASWSSRFARKPQELAEWRGGIRWRDSHGICARLLGLRGAARKDHVAVKALAKALAGSNRPLVIASALRFSLQYGLRRRQTCPTPQPAAAIRIPFWQVLTDAADEGLRAVRLSPSVLGDWQVAFVPALTRRRTVDGPVSLYRRRSKPLAAVHRLDAARLFRLAVESASTNSRLHPVADQGVPLRDIAVLIGRRLDLPVVSIAPDHGLEHFGWLFHFASMTIRLSSALTQALLGWRPTQPDLLTDIDRNAYFAIKPSKAEAI